ncbi:U3 small nucleolar RNA-associated protein 13, partial [Tremellales sp. Uapishka_1]
MNGQSSKRALKTSFRASPTSIRPLYTGGPVLLTRDGEWMITTMGEEILVTEVKSGLGVGRIRGDTTAITSLVLSYHTSPPTLITSHLSNTIRYYPLPESLPLTPKPPLLSYTRALTKASSAPILISAVSPDHTLLATGSSDGIVKVWDLEGGYVTHMFRGHGGPVSALRFNFPDLAEGEDRKRMELLTGSTDTRVRIYDLRDAKARLVGGGGVAKPLHVLEGHVSVVRGIDVSADGKWAVTGGRDKVVLVWDLLGNKKGPKLVQTIMALEQVESLGLLPLEQEVVGGERGRLHCFVAGDKGVVKIWDVLKAKEVTSMQVSVHADQNIIFHNLSTGDVARQIVGFNDEIIDAVYLSSATSADSQLALATNSNLVRIYSTSSFDVRLLSGHKDMVLCLDKSIDGRWLVSGSKDRTARVWVDGKCLAVLEGHAESIGAVAISRKLDERQKSGRFMFTASQDRTVKMWDLTGIPYDGKLDQAIKPKSFTTLRVHDKDINSLDLSPNDKLLASGSQDKLVKIFEVDFSVGNAGGASGALKLVGECKGHRRGVWTVKFSRTDRIVASGAADRTVRLWSLDDFSCLKTFEGHTNSVLRVDFLSQGMQLVTSASDGLVKLWNIKGEECITTLDNHEDKIWALAVSSDEKTIVSAGADSLATFWEDSTEVEQAEKNDALVKAVQSEQDFTNYLALKDYRKAILLALAMSQPGRLLNLFLTVALLRTPGTFTGSKEVDQVIKTLPGMDLVRLLKHVRDWNSRAKTSPVAQTLLHAILRLRTPEDIMAAFDSMTRKPKQEDEEAEADVEDNETNFKKQAVQTIGIKELLDGLIPYSERHFTRIDKLVQESYMLDYALGEMDGGLFGGEVMEMDS